MTKKAVLVSLWAAVGVSFLYLGSSDVLRWRSDSAFARIGLDWTDSSVPHGFVALLVAVGLAVPHRAGSWLAIGCSLLFGVYYAAYLVFGGEGTLFLRIGMPVLLLALVAATLRLLRSAMTTSSMRSRS